MKKKKVFSKIKKMQRTEGHLIFGNQPVTYSENFYDDEKDNDNSISLSDGAYRGTLNGTQIQLLNQYPPFSCPLKYAILGKASVAIVVKNNRFQVIEINDKPVWDPSEHESRKDELLRYWQENLSKTSQS